MAYIVCTLIISRDAIMSLIYQFLSRKANAIFRMKSTHGTALWLLTLIYLKLLNNVEHKNN